MGTTIIPFKHLKAFAEGHPKAFEHTNKEVQELEGLKRKYVNILK